MVIEKINKEGHNAAFNPVTIHCAQHGMENRRFELRPPGESKLPLSNRKYTYFFENSHNKNFYKFLDFYRIFRVLLHYY